VAAARFALVQQPPDLDQVGLGALAEGANSLGALGQKGGVGL
jgi:hypothetical protein